MASPNLDDASASPSDSHLPVLVVSRHVCLERIQSEFWAHEAVASVPPEKMSRPGKLTVALNAADGARAWIEGEALQVLSPERCVLPKGGFLKDSEGVCLAVPPGAWRVRVQVAYAGVKVVNRNRDPHRHEW